MKKILFVILSTLLVCCPALAQNTRDLKPSFAWTANTETNLAGYKIYVGEGTRDYQNCAIDIPNKDAVSYDFTDEDVSNCNMIENFTYYFAATAYDTDGFESDYSDEVVWTTPIILHKVRDFTKTN